jgi:peptidoglycan/LPS O-acetylase OafA/YrhL
MGSVDLAGRAVDLFFILSGFLITNLLLAEDARSGRIALGAFFIRRVFRIAPSLIAVALGAAMLGGRGLIAIADHEKLMAVTFQCNLPWGGCTWWLGHTWSVAIEQQFYLVWPIAFILLGRRHRATGSLMLAGAAAIAATLLPSVNPIACIGAGVALACNPALRFWISRRLCSDGLVIAAITIAMASSLMTRWTALDRLLVSVHPLALAILLVATLDGRGRLARFTSSRLLQRIGVMSYSLYLWQQLFTGRPEYYLQPLSTGWVALMIPCALACHLLIEKPSITLGRRLAAALTRGGGPARRPEASAAAMRETLAG